MSDESELDGLSVEELEEILQSKRRARALRRFRRVTEGDVQDRDEFVEHAETTRRLSPGREAPRDRKGKFPGGVHSSGAPVTSRQDSFGEEGASFKAAKIVPETSKMEGAASLLSRANRGFWLRGVSRVRDRLLLLLELAALAGLIFVIYSSFSNLHLLNKEVAEALEAENSGTPAATPATTLPGGSLPPSSEGSVPGQLRHLVEPGASIPIPTPGPRQASRVVIPSIDVDAPVVQGDGWEELKMGAGHRIGSANPGERGNIVISGHNDVYGEIFRYLEDVNVGDEAIVYAGGTPYVYLVVAKMVVQPSEVSLLEPTPNATLTLITCHPYMVDTHRLVVVAELANQ
jgi:sortase A